MTEFPHLALIGYDDKEEDIIYYCLGALVSDRFVLTAARCLRYGPGPPKVIRVGGISSNDKNMEDVKAETFFIHPDYGKKSNDIGLIKLEKSITIDQFKRPACLPSAPDWPQSFAFETNIYRLEKKLFIQKSKLEKYSEEECKRFYPEEYIHTNISYEIQICAGTKRSERDLIRQSSRGPLQIYHPNEFCMYEIVGINSFGECCATLTPDVFTRIHSYNDWIESIVWK